jgi:hypothetical protein
VKLLHDADVRNGHQGRFRIMYPYALMTRLSVLPLAAERDNVFVDSCAAINVFPSTHQVSGAVLNCDPGVGIVAINGSALSATHTAYHKALGKTIIVPGVQAALASVAELTKHGHNVLFKTDGIFLITTENSRATYEGFLNESNIYEMSKTEYVCLQNGTPQTPVVRVSNFNAFPTLTTPGSSDAVKSNGVTRAAKQGEIQPAAFTVEQQTRATRRTIQTASQKTVGNVNRQ